VFLLFSPSKDEEENEEANAQVYCQDMACVCDARNPQSKEKIFIKVTKVEYLFTGSKLSDKGIYKEKLCGRL